MIYGLDRARFRTNPLSTGHLVLINPKANKMSESHPSSVLAILTQGANKAQLSQYLSLDQIRTVLQSWLPTTPFMKRITTGVLTVDIFFTSAVVALIMTALNVAKAAAETVMKPQVVQSNDHVVFVLESCFIEKNGFKKYNDTWKALVWLLANKTANVHVGTFRQPETVSSEVDGLPEHVDVETIGSDLSADILDPQTASRVSGIPRPTVKVNEMLPERDQDVLITVGDFDFELRTIKSNFSSDPAIKVRRISTAQHPCPQTSVQWMQAWLRQLTRHYLSMHISVRSRSLWQWSTGGDRWVLETTLPPALSSGTESALERVALDEAVHRRLKQDLVNFVEGKEFYNKVGMPYRRGYLLSGKPGTGKTSLVHAIARHLNRDLYFVKLSSAKNDRELRNMFRSIPAESVVVLEDVDAQSKVVHLRVPEEEKPDSDTGSDDDTLSNGSVSIKDQVKRESITLSELLDLLDGHSVKEGQLFILTSNHPEVLDPALIRPGRVDWHFEMQKASHYQLQAMNRLIRGNDGPPLELDTIPERSIVPCEAMRTILMLRTEPSHVVVKALEECVSL